MNNNPKKIIIVDDSDIEFDLICWGLEQSGITYPIVRAQTAEEGLEILGINPADPHPPPASDRPILILLDISMPGMGGLGFLRVLNRMPELLDIPVVIMSSSSNPADITMSYQLGASAYFKKPGNLQEYADKMRDIMLVCFE